MATVASQAAEVLRATKAVVTGFYPTAEVLVFGSVARGTADAESDCDILVLTDQVLSTQDKDAVRDALYDLQLEHDAVISAQFYAKDQWDSALYRAMPFHQEVDRDAVEL